jgi:hypothetical protein
MKQKIKSRSREAKKIVVWPSPCLMVGLISVAAAIIAGGIYSENMDTNHFVPAVLLILVSIIPSLWFKNGRLVFLEDTIKMGSKSVRFNDIESANLESAGFGASRHSFYNFYDVYERKALTINPNAYGYSAKRINGLLLEKLSHIGNIGDVIIVKPGRNIENWLAAIIFTYIAFLGSAKWN